MSFWDELQLQQVLADRKQRETVRSAEIEFLEQAQTLADFRQAMDEKNQQLAEPDAPLDECSFRDYCIRRNAGEGK